MAQQSESRDQWRWVWRAAESAALLGAIAYAFLREEYRVFYNDLRVTPDDVGLDPIEMLSGSAFGVLAIGVALVAVGAGVLLAVGAARGRPAGTRLAPPHVLVALSVAALIALHIAVRDNAHRAGDCVRAGSSLRYITILGIPLLNVRAQEANVAWVGVRAGTRPKLGPRMLFVGQNDGIAVLYDIGTKTPVRIPATDIAISLPPVEEGCRTTRRSPTSGRVDPV